MDYDNYTVRSKRSDVVAETVHRWHRGPGAPGGRTYDVLYVRDGRVRIDVSGAWSSTYHTIWMEPEEVRPHEEWLAHLRKTGREPTEPRWCAMDGREIPAERIERETPDEPELYCSADCYRDYRESLPTW